MKVVVGCAHGTPTIVSDSGGQAAPGSRSANGCAKRGRLDRPRGCPIAHESMENTCNCMRG